jgi:hypothetical protein
MHDFDSNFTLVAKIFREVNGRHAALAELAIYGVLVSECRGETGERSVSHAARRE